MSDTKVQVRCDADIRITTYSSLFGEQVDIVRADLVDAHLGVMAIMHGKISGYEGNAAPCKITGLELVNPDDELKDGAECPCGKHG